MSFRPSLLLVLLFAGAAQAQQSPYAGYQDRPIKALSPQQMGDLNEGRGMSLALAAELNGYPGPKHVLELRDSLGLSDSTAAAVAAVFELMQQRARELGRRIIEQEAALDSAFGSGAITSADLSARVQRIAGLQGRLRAVHLQAHLETAALLSEHERMSYQRLRGYGTTGHDGGHDH